VETLQAIGDFVEFYLSPDQPSKNIEFIQLKLHRKAQKILRKTSDELLLKVACFQESLRLLKRYRKHGPDHRRNLLNTPTERLYRELTHLNPEDCLLLIASERYHLDDSTLSLISKQSEASVSFRREQLKQHLQEEAIPLINLASLSPKTLTTRLAIAAPPRPNKNLYHSFQALPFPARFAIETLSVLSILVLLMWIIPEIRNTYENSVQKRINDYLIESSLVDSPAPEGTTKEARVLPTPNPQDEEEPETSQPSAPPVSSKKQPKVNEGETWRFSFTGSMTNDIETNILLILKKAGLDQNKPLTVPGGIQFDFMLPIQNLIPLKTSLEEMTSDLQHKSPANHQNLMSSASMSWYKRKMLGGRKIPRGQVEVMIWISTL
jgi:hypothetical protein